MLTAVQPTQQFSPTQYWSYFPTPDELCLKLIDLAQPKVGDRILEPSAGTGHLAKWIRASCPATWIEVCEIVPEFQRTLTALGFPVVAGDFISLDVQPIYDLVISNPPFDRQMSHIRKMWRHLRKGGRLVSLASARYRWEKTNRQGYYAPIYDEFREWLRSVRAVDIELPPGSFADSERPTNVEVCILVVDKY